VQRSNPSRVATDAGAGAPLRSATGTRQHHGQQGDSLAAECPQCVEYAPVLVVGGGRNAPERACLCQQLEGIVHLWQLGDVAKGRRTTAAAEAQSR